MTFQVLYERLHDPIEHWFAHQTYTNQDPEGWAAETFAKALAHPRQFRDDRHQEYWIWLIARNLYKDECRHRHSHLSQDTMPLTASHYEVSDRRQPIGQQIEDRDQYSHLVAIVVQVLTTREATVLLLLAEGVSQVAIARSMHVKPPVVRALVWRARRRLQARLGYWSS